MTAASMCPASPSVEGVRISERTQKIVDYALEIIDSDNLDFIDDGEALPALDILSSSSTQNNNDSSSHHPPLHQLVTRRSSSTLSDDNNEEDDDDVSTISGGEDTNATSSSRRSIFKPYWEKTGETKPRLEPVPMSVMVPVQLQQRQQQQPQTSTKTDSSSAFFEAHKNDRRSIFGQGCWSRSEPAISLQSLAPHLCLSTNFRKAHSSSSLQSQPKSSCLRRGKFSSSTSSSRRPRRDSDSSSVKFSEDVAVYVFQKSAERFAHEGWSKWFA